MKLRTDLHVLLPMPRSSPVAKDRPTLALRVFKGRYLMVFLLGLGLFVLAGESLAGPGKPGIIRTLLKWTPMMFWGPPSQFGGFSLNLVVSFLSMAIGTILGLFVGLGQLSIYRPIRSVSWFFTQIFRNSPWLVLMFYIMFALPYKINWFGTVIQVPAWIKATLGLSLPIMGNISEIVRGAVKSIPVSQWEAAESLAFKRFQTLRMIILPQCVKRMIPPWMNWYAILTMATPIIAIVGVNDALLLARDALAAENRGEVLIPMYLYLLTWFFIYCYPIARLTARLERKYHVNI